MTWREGGAPRPPKSKDRRMNVLAGIALLFALGLFFFLWGLTVGAVLWR